MLKAAILILTGFHIAIGDKLFFQCCIGEDGFSRTIMTPKLFKPKRKCMSTQYDDECQNRENFFYPSKDKKLVQLDKENKILQKICSLSVDLICRNEHYNPGNEDDQLNSGESSARLLII